MGLHGALVQAVLVADDNVFCLAHALFASSPPCVCVCVSVCVCRRASSSTRLLFCTTGVLLRQLQSDPAIHGISHVFVDEVRLLAMKTPVALSVCTSPLSSCTRTRTHTLIHTHTHATNPSTSSRTGSRAQPGQRRAAGAAARCSQAQARPQGGADERNAGRGQVLEVLWGSARH